MPKNKYSDNTNHSKSREKKFLAQPENSIEEDEEEIDNDTLERQLSLLNKGNKQFIDSTKRRFGKINLDQPSKELKTVRNAFNKIVKQPDEKHVLKLEEALSHWQQYDPNEFAKRSELVKNLRSEMSKLISHRQAQRAKSAGILGITVAPQHVKQFNPKVLFDGFGRVVGLKEDITQDEISNLTHSKIKSLTQTNSTAEREAPKTESESIIAFVTRLEEAATPETRPLIERAKELWFTGKVTEKTIKKLFEDAVTQLHAYPELQSLAQQLHTDASKKKTTGQYIDSLFGRRFDSELAHEMVKAPSENAKKTSRQTGQFLIQEFEQFMHKLFPNTADSERHDDRITAKMASFAKDIKKDIRPWFSQVPELTAFLDEPTFANFKAMMTKVNDGFDVIKVPFLAVKMAISQDMGMGQASWKTEGDRFYMQEVTKTRSTGTQLTAGTDLAHKVKLIEQQTDDYGTALPYQPAGDKYDNFGYGRKVAAGRILTPGQETEFERNALAQGHSVVTGASGSTNIMVHLNNYIASKDPSFSADQGYLNTLAFLVFDGGHSVNESLAVYKALQVKGDERKQVLQSYTANYTDLIDIAGEASEKWVKPALDNAFKKTQELYRKIKKHET
ncbi:hypothetical protein LGZ99_04845 [Photorhabdus temperata]|nr:RTX toxin [Photorhabdus temperata]MCT8346559.1 hypothetical protein [Photorhabdus temperata]